VEALTLEAAASSGEPIARYQLALERLEAGANGDGAALMRRAAEQGVPDAMRRFGLMQARGEGVPVDAAAGRAMVVAAAEAGNVQAMHDAGGLFISAEGAPGAEEAAARWFQQGALHGVRDSQFNMALLFQEGFGVPQSAPDAYAWFLIAAAAGDGDAGQRASTLRRTLSADQRTAAEAVAQGFTARAADPALQGAYPAQPWNASDQDLIARTQTLLTDLGYDPGPADGVMGDQTRRAIVSYQRAAGLEPGGALNARLVARLEQSAAD
jgi:localization factor PodJL